MVNYKVSAVSYLNTIPFIHGIKSSNISDFIDLQLDYPSVCAQKLINNEVDIALVPVVVLKDNPQFNIISDYCIGSNGKVDTVCLYSDVPLKEIKEIYLDYQSRTSIELLKVLCKEHWNISPKFRNSPEGFENKIERETAALIIGDRAFSANGKYKFVYDLSESWKEMTGLSFVFACWISNKNIEENFTTEFNKSLKMGVENVEEAIKKESDNYPHCINPKEYLNHKISYLLDENKRKGMELFLDKIN
ncbi:MAG: menaquinone biosynthesis protein [Flavobacteriales bacterium]|nr:menaquinone biosynthesis protein [Flavobacteriales bacterium]